MKTPTDDKSIAPVSRARSFGAFFLLALTFAAYIPALRGGFVWDDDVQVAANPLLRSASGLFHIWTSLGPARGGTPQFYPLTFSAFWLEYHLWHLNPVGYHAVNVLLHGLNAVLVWRLLLGLQLPGALLAAAIFALHPVHVESVAWIIELKNVLSGQFYLLSLSLFLRYWDSARSSKDAKLLYWPANFLFLCALGAKTSTIALPAVILLILWWKNGRLGWSEIKLLSPMLALGFGAGLVTTYVEYQGARGSGWAMSLVQHVVLAGRIPWFYAGKLAWPNNLSFVYPRWNLDQLGKSRLLFPLSALAVPAGLWAARGRIGRGPAAAVLAFIASLVPVMGFLNIYYMRYSYVADHFQYLASLGLIVLGACGLARLFGTAGSSDERAALAYNPVGIALSGALLCALGTLTWRQGRIYRDPGTLWQDVLAKNPTSFNAQNFLGASLAARGRTAEAIEHYNLALQSGPDFAEARSNLGLALASQGKIDEAIRQYGLALQAHPNFASAQNNWGLALVQKGEIDEAIEHYNAALLADPNSAAVHSNLGLALSKQGKADEAIRHFKLALLAEPGQAEIENNLGVALFGSGKIDEAIRHYESALAARPDDTEVHINLGVALSGQGRREEAVRHFNLALLEQPDSVSAHCNLGDVLARQGKIDDAIRHYKLALRARPDFARADNSLGVALAGQGRGDEAIRHFNQALRPDYADPYNNLGLALAGRGKLDQAILNYERALKIQPRYAEAQSNLGLALSSQGKLDEAVRHFKLALQTRPDFLDAYNGLGIALARQRKRGEAVEIFRHALRLDPGYAPARGNLEILLKQIEQDRSR